MTNRQRHTTFFVLTLAFILPAKFCFSQEAIKPLLQLDTSWTFPTITFTSLSISADYQITHSPTKEDTLFCMEHSALTQAQPTPNNYSNYYTLACALWELNRIEEAEKMFLTIVASTEDFYVDTYSGSSDIPDDTSTNLYGYGSYTYNYKNYACRYLT